MSVRENKVSINLSPQARLEEGDSATHGSSNEDFSQLSTTESTTTEYPQQPTTQQGSRFPSVVEISSKEKDDEGREEFLTHPPGQPPDVHFQQMFSKLSYLIFAQGQSIAHGMKEMEEELEQVVRLDAGDASKVVLIFKHPVLQAHSDILIQYLDANPDLIASLISEGLLAENAKISEDTNEKSRTKRILLEIQDVDCEGLCVFIRALESGGPGSANALLGHILRERYNNWREGGREGDSKITEEDSTEQETPRGLRETVVEEQEGKKKRYVNTTDNIAEHQFSSEERADLVSCKIYNIIPIGDTGAGKTSLTRSLVLKGSYMTSVDDRTVVAQLLSWSPDEKQDTVFLIYDTGGHDSYKNTSQCFQVNDPTTLRLLCHDVTSSNIQASVDWIKETQTAAPDSKLVLCLTKIDLLGNEASREEPIRKCLDSFSEIIDQEIQRTKDSQRLTAKETTNWKLYEKHLKCYRLVKEQIKSNPILLSCTPGHENLLSKFRDYLLNLGDSEQPFLLSETDKELFLRIGKLGRKEPMLEQRHVIDRSSPAPIEVRSTPSTVQSAPLVALEKDLSQVQVQSEPESPETNEQEAIEELRQQYVPLEEALSVFKAILQEKNINLSDSVNKLKRSLENLSKKGLLKYFLGDKDLENIIFNDISTLINLLRAIFHHSTKEFLNFKHVDVILRESLYNSSADHFNDDVFQLQQHGIMSMNLLKVLLQKSNCLIEPVIVVKLLAKLTIAYTYERKDTDDIQTFVPYFIERKVAPEFYQSNVLTCGDGLLSLHTVIKGELPLSFFHTFIVKVYGEYHDSDITLSQNETRCKDFFTLGRNRAKFMIFYNSKKEIECYVQAEMSVDGHRTMWKCIKFFNSTAKETRKSMFPGLIFDYLLMCTHCELISLGDGEQQVSVYAWDVERKLLPNESKEFEQYCCRCDGLPSDIPAALVAPLPKDDQKARLFLHQLCKHLKKIIPGNCQTHEREQRQARPLESVITRMPSVHDLEDKKTEPKTRLGTKRTGECYQQWQSNKQTKQGGDTEEINFRHPVLQMHRDPLVDNLNPTEELVCGLMDRDVINLVEGREILHEMKRGDSNKESFVKPILSFLEDVESSGLCALIEVLLKCEPSGTNAALGNIIRQSYADWLKESSTNQ